MTASVCSTCGQRYDRLGYCSFDGQPLAATDDPLLGTEVGRYRMTRLLGEGGMGRVYLAVQPAIGSRVAIKILSDQCARNPELLDRFFAEARAVNLIHHESIVSVIDMAQLPDGRPFIVMEYIEGQTLAAIGRAGQVPLGGLVQVMAEVLSALSAAHAIGIVHRDLKPDNILVTAEGHAKVLDFGIAKLAPELGQQLSPRTRTGALLGTPQYMAPEQISGSGAVDPRTDLYAAGVLVYELVTGRLPFVGETLYDLMRGHLEMTPPPPRGLRKDLPPAFEQAILKALAKRSEARFQSAGEMSQALQVAASTLPVEQWRPLSGRTGLAGSGPRSVPRRSQLPLDPRETRPVGAAPTVDGSGRIGLVVGAIVIAAIAVVVTLFAVAHRRAPEPVAQAPVVQAPVVQAPAPGPTVPAAPAPTSPAPPAPAPAPEQVPPAHTVPHAKPKPAPAPSAPPSGPTIVGGGSAADHGVVIGPGVETNAGVVVGAAVPVRHEIVHPADYDPRHFDPVAYLPKAIALAHELLPDARLTSFEFDPAFSDGHVDLTSDGRDRDYEFRSPSRSAFPAGRPANQALARMCRIKIEVGVRSISARVVESDTCNDRFVRLPRCSFAGIWKQALASGAKPDLIARIGWMSDETWFFDLEPSGSGGVSSYADRCP